MGKNFQTRVLASGHVIEKSSGPSYSEMGVFARLASALMTWAAFWLALSTLPGLLIWLISVRTCQNIWLKILQSRFPDLEFVTADTLRALLDTRRNQGIINVLLTVKGTYDMDAIRAQLSRSVVERRAPNARAALVSRWGSYAWRAHAFRLDDHLLLGAPSFRGRPISDANIQEYVSDIVSKYLPPDLPAWQMIVIPNIIPSDEKYHILVRVHHLLLSGSGSLNIGDFLLMKGCGEQAISLQELKDNPLTRLLEVPTAIPELYAKISDSCSNRWNEFISEYDPVESPQAMKTKPGLFHCAGLVIIIIVSALREFSKEQSGLTDTAGRVRIFFECLQRERRRREFALSKIMYSISVTFAPRMFMQTWLKVTSLMVTYFVTFPLRMYMESASLFHYLATGYSPYQDTVVSLLYGYVPLGYRAARELYYILHLVYTAPILLFKELFLGNEDISQRHQLQTVSMCGRKAVSWSRAVSRSTLAGVARAHGVSETDVELFAVMEALKAYFEKVRALVPNNVLMTARTASLDFLLATSDGDGRYYKKTQTGAMVCLSLPMECPAGAAGAAPTALRRVRDAVHGGRRRQAALAALSDAQTRWGALTRALPSPLVRVALNALTRRFAVSVAEVCTPAGAAARTTLWGHSVTDIVYWRPPQANISVSFTIIQYADHVRIAVMTDALLSPGHIVPALRWPHIIEQLAKANHIPMPHLSANTQERIGEDQDEDNVHVSTSQAKANIQIIIDTGDEREVTKQETVKNLEPTHSDFLKPPTTGVVSPPVRRKDVQRHKEN